MKTENIDAILRLLTAYEWPEVKEAFKRLNKDWLQRRSDHRRQAFESMRSLGWLEHEGEVPKGFEWQMIGSQLWVRDPSNEDPTRVTVSGSNQSSSRKRTDTSVKPIQDLKCPRCGSEMFKEGICPGCTEGRRGLKVRLLCGECDYTLAL